DDDRVRALQQDGQALPLHGRMESADDDHTRTAKFVRQVVGLNDELAGALDGAEQRQCFSLEDFKIAADGQRFRGELAEVGRERHRKAQVGAAEFERGIHKRHYSGVSGCSNARSFPTPEAKSGARENVTETVTTVPMSAYHGQYTFPLRNQLMTIMTLTEAAMAMTTGCGRAFFQ